MMAAISAGFALLKQPKALAIGAVALAVSAVFLWQRWTIADLRTDVARLDGQLALARANLETAARVNDRNVAELDKVRSAVAADRTAFGAELANLEARCQARTAIKKEIQRVQAQSPAQCPVADSVRAALRGLQPDP